MVEDHDALSKAQVDGIGLSNDEPSFLGQPIIDTLLESVISLGGELWVERDRRRALEALMINKGLVSRDEIDARTLTPEQQAERDAALKSFVDTILGPLTKLGNNA